jgi:hypothetical protein
MFYLSKHILLLTFVIFKLKCNNLIFNKFIILNVSYVCLLHSRFVENHLIWILKDGHIISEVVLLQPVNKLAQFSFHKFQKLNLVSKTNQFLVKPLRSGFLILPTTLHMVHGRFLPHYSEPNSLKRSCMKKCRPGQLPILRWGYAARGAPRRSRPVGTRTRKGKGSGLRWIKSFTR